MATVVLRGRIEVANALEVALELLKSWAGSETYDLSRPASFDESDLRLANRGGARTSAAEIAAILERRREIESALRSIPADSSLAARTVPWAELTRLFEAFADIRGVGFSKMTKALHKKRPALIPILDSVVQGYLPAEKTGSFGARATALTRSYKQDLDLNRAALREVMHHLSGRGYPITEVRLLDLLIWSAY